MQVQEVVFGYEVVVMIQRFSSTSSDLLIIMRDRALDTVTGLLLI